MKESLTIGYITSRPEPNIHWFFASLRRQMKPDDNVRIIVVDFFSQACDDWTQSDVNARQCDIFQAAEDYELMDNTSVVPPKPTVWQGPSRVTKINWWAMSNSRNTALCLCQTPWVAFCDDRTVLAPTWLEAIERGMVGNYAVAGAYKKHWGMRVEGGVVTGYDKLDGVDHRLALANGKPLKCAGSWLYGFAAYPLEWGLQANGYEELLDGMSFEDVIFGLVLENNGRKFCYDPDMLAFQDRTPGQIGRAFRREDKGPVGTIHDKSHESLRRFATKKRAQHPWDFVEIRKALQRGEGWPSVDKFPKTDWFDGTLIADADKT